jgi:hypothetical protein
MSVNWEIKETFQKITIELEVFASFDAVNIRYETPIMKTNINVCKLYNSLTGNIFLKPIVDEMYKNSNLPKSCPIAPGNYTVQNFAPEKLMLPLDMFKFKFIENITGVLKKAKSRRKICSISILGAYDKN